MQGRLDCIAMDVDREAGDNITYKVSCTGVLEPLSFFFTGERYEQGATTPFFNADQMCDLEASVSLKSAFCRLSAKCPCRLRHKDLAMAEELHCEAENRAFRLHALRI